MNQKFVPMQGKVLQEFLFDGLMELIESDLMNANKVETAHKLAAMDVPERDEAMKRYEAALIEFTEKWPGYIEDRIALLEGQVKVDDLKVANEEFSVMQHLEDLIEAEDE